DVDIVEGNIVSVDLLDFADLAFVIKGEGKVDALNAGTKGWHAGMHFDFVAFFTRGLPVALAEHRRVRPDAGNPLYRFLPALDCLIPHLDDDIIGEVIACRLTERMDAC